MTIGRNGVMLNALNINLAKVIRTVKYYDFELFTHYHASLRGKIGDPTFKDEKEMRKHCDTQPTWDEGAFQAAYEIVAGEDAIYNMSAEDVLNILMGGIFAVTEIKTNQSSEKQAWMNSLMFSTTKEVTNYA